MRWWGALTCLDLVAKPSPAPEARAGPAVWPGREPQRTDGRCPATAAPAPRPRAGPRPLRGAASYEAEG